MGTDFWVVQTTHGQYRVDEATAEQVRAEVMRYAGKPAQENQEIAFVDDAGSHAFIMLGTYLGILESTKEQRSAERAFNRRLDKEKEEDQPSWE